MALIGTPVFDPDRHEPLDAAPFDPAAVRRAIGEILDDFARARLPDGHWPTHPLDHPTRRPLYAAYAGAAGAASVLRLLRRAGYEAADADEHTGRIFEAWQASPDYGRLETGLQLGEIGMLAPALLADPEAAEIASRLRDAMRRTLGHPARETTSGETGMLHAALTLYRETGDEAWGELYARGAESLWKTWERDPATGGWFWESHIFGSVRHYYGACHGVAGNVHALLRGADLLPPEWLSVALERATRTLARGALRSPVGTSWPVSADASGRRRLVQWCHGAAGVVCALADTPRLAGETAPILDRLLLEAGELTWGAGPLTKGGGLCHGTAGNGLAFLGLHRRTGDPRWLDRARAFAMHAIGQSRRARSQYGQGRHTLWTGDGGLALYLDQCLTPAHVGFPGLELL